MGGSPFDARIRSDVLAILRDVLARHVAGILPQLADAEVEGVDPARAVRLGDAAARNIVANAALDHGIAVQQRPAGAPVRKPGKHR